MIKYLIFDEHNNLVTIAILNNEVLYIDKGYYSHNVMTKVIEHCKPEITNTIEDVEYVFGYPTEYAPIVFYEGNTIRVVATEDNSLLYWVDQTDKEVTYPEYNVGEDIMGEMIVLLQFALLMGIKRHPECKIQNKLNPQP